MEIRIRIGKVEEQDTMRREDMLRMTPAQRVEALVEMRDRMYPYEPMEMVFTIRSLD